MQVKNLQDENSATRIARDLAGHNQIDATEIRADDLAGVYSGLVQVYPDANFSLAQSIIPGIDMSGRNPGQKYHGVIVETRRHHALETVVRNVIEVCNIPVQLFHGLSNLDYIMSTSIAELVGSGQVVLTEIPAETLEPRDYNGLLMSDSFWHCMMGRGKILIFQTDSICCRASDFKLRDFSEYDYIGSNWDRVRPVGLVIDGGNGGFSLRDWQKSVRCLGRFDPAAWPGGEDGYFAFHLDLMGARVARYAECSKFGTQLQYEERSFGCHQVNHLEKSQFEAFARYCPEIGKVFPRMYQQLKTL